MISTQISVLLRGISPVPTLKRRPVCWYAPSLRRATLLFRAVFTIVSIISALNANSQGQSSDFTVVVLPDTQYYSSTYPATFQGQTTWIANNATSLNIQMVLGVGDVVDNPTVAQLQNADTAVKILDGAGIPYLLAIGNHDYDNENPSSRSANAFNSYFGPQRYSAARWYAGQYPPGSNENFYGVLTIGGTEYLFMCLEYYPRDAALAWARSVIQSHPNDEVIIVTHAYEFKDNTRVGMCNDQGPVSDLLPNDSDGEKLWDNFIKQFRNITLVLNGHFINGDATGEAVGRRGDPDVGINGNIVNQVLANYQAVANGGNGYLRILTFHPSLNTIDISTYSPSLNSYLTDSNNKFTVPWHGSASSAAGTTTLSGIVWDGSCNAIAGATVSAGGTTTTTSSSGKFSMTVPTPGSYVVSTSPSGLGSASRTFTAALSYPATIKLQLSTGNASISGSVSDANGPIAGALVSYNQASTLTDMNGNYIISNVPVGTWDITAVSSTYWPVTQTINAASGATAVANFLLSSSSRGAINGTVVDFLGNELAAAFLSYNGGSAMSNTYGAYTLWNLVPGTYTVTASAEGYQNETQSTTVVAGTATTLNFALASSTAGAIQGNVSNTIGGPIAGATILYSSGSVTADTSGNYVIPNLAPGTYTLTASATGYQSSSQTSSVAVGIITTMNVTLVATPSSITGNITSAAGGIITGAIVSYAGGSTTTDTYGNYTLANVAPGTYAVTASASGYQNTVQSAVVAAGATTLADFILGSGLSYIAGSGSTANSTNTLNTSISISLGRTIPAGNTIVVAATFNSGSPGKVTSVTDNAGNVYLQRVNHNSGTVVDASEIWSTAASGSTGSASIVTINYAAGVEIAAAAAAYARALSIGPSVVAGNTGSTTASTTLTTQDNNNFVLGVLTTSNAQSGFVSKTGSLRATTGNGIGHTAISLGDNTFASPGTIAYSNSVTNEGWISLGLELRSVRVTSKITAIPLASGGSNTATATYNTVSIAPTSNALILVTVRNTVSSGAPGIPTLSGNGLTYVQVATEPFGTIASPLRRITMFRAMASSPTPGTITISFSGTQSNCSWTVDQLIGADTTGSNGSGAIIQNAVNANDNASSLTLTLASFAGSQNAAYGVFGDVGTNEDLSPGKGFGLISSTATYVPVGSIIDDNTTNVTDGMPSGGGSHPIAGIAVEVAAGP
jgi:hypothetical protein